MTSEVDSRRYLETEFSRLSEMWLRETRYTSDIQLEHPAYEQIIALGERVVPVILEDLSRKSNHWFIALKAITGENPVPEDHIGKVELMRNDWLVWGRIKGLLSDTSEK